ncbi:MAG: hypothetical protein LQ337_009023, partial [Flavoplaca oasis]
MREHNGGGIGSGKRPLQEMDFGAGATFAWEGEDEVRVFAGGILDAEVGVGFEDGAEGGWGIGVAETPDVFDFLPGEDEGFGEVE